MRQKEERVSKPDRLSEAFTVAILFIALAVIVFG